MCLAKGERRYRMLENITATVEKDDGHGFLKTDAMRLTEIGGDIAHTITCRDGALCVQHCNLIIEVEKLEEIKELGGLEEGSSQRRKVFDENGVSPTLQAAMGAGGGNVPLVVDAVIGSMQENAMVGNGKYSPSLTSAMGMGGGQIPMITERTCVAMRGRNPENPSDRTSGIELEQRLEINNTGCTNTLTTVQKDNLVLEEQVLAYDEQNQTIRTETFGTLTTDGSSPKHNNRVIKIKQVTKQSFIEYELDGNIQIDNPIFYNFLYEIDGEIYLIRIRKLIPLECWRLMGFTDEDFSKAEKVNSNTQLYKQAGNSIVCDCLEAIFSQMNIKGVTAWNEKQKELGLST